MDGTSWQITNKCYNSKLYSCQCLEVGVVLRYADIPTLEAAFNGIKMPACADEPDCAPEVNQNNCPYTLDPESELLCQMLTELNELATNSTQYHSTSNSVTCPYLNNPTSSFLLCNLWCQIQGYLGNTCTDISSTEAQASTSPSCPYLSYTNSVTLCDLWTSLQALTSSTPTTNPTQTTILYSDCPHFALSDAILACELWCQVGQLESNSICSGGPTCPYENYTFPHNDELCKLWAENLNVESIIFGSSATTTTDGLTPIYTTDPSDSLTISCIYELYPYSSDYCSIWCETQWYKYGQMCGEVSTTTQTSAVCPYLSSTDSSTLCSLWEELNNLANSGVTPSITSTVSYATCPHLSLTESVTACALWCQIQEYTSGAECSSSTTTTDSTTLATCPYGEYTDSVVLCFLWEQIQLEKNSGSTIHSVTFTVQYTTCPHVDITDNLLACEMWCQLQEYTAWSVCENGPTCPYENYTSPYDDELCTLWAENVNIENTLFGSTTPSSLNGLTPLYSTQYSESNVISCIYRSMDRDGHPYTDDFCSIWCETQFYKYGQICEENLSTTTSSLCPYKTYTDNDVLCFLWEQLEIEKISGSTVHSVTFEVPYTGCPHLGLTDSVLACEMWCSLQEYTAWAFCSNGPVCPYENYTSPHNTELCILWIENVNIENNLFGSTTPSSLNGVSPLYSTDSTEESVVHCIYNSTEQYAEEYCLIWCETQFYKYGQTCEELATSSSTAAITTESVCPYLNYVDSVVLCFVWEQLENEKAGGATPHSVTFEVEYSGCPHLDLTDGILACEMWCQLQEYTAWAFCANGPSCPYENITKPYSSELCTLWAENLNIENTLFGSTTPSSLVGITPLYSTESSDPSTIPCIYRDPNGNDHPYVDYFCNLWCETQYYKYGQTCEELLTTTTESVTNAAGTTTESQCPYDEYTDNSVLCFLWNQIEVEQNSGSTISSVTFPVEYTACPHVDITDGLLACEMWCQLQEYTAWAMCINGPECPYKTYPSPDNDELCKLWAENVNIENNIFGSTTPQSIEGITPLYSTMATETNMIQCIYTGNNFDNEYCSIWCETQFYKYGQVCEGLTTTETATTEKTCPYDDYTSSLVLCFLWEQIEIEKHSGSTIHSFTFSIPYTSCPHIDIEDGILACEMWCQLQEWNAWTVCLNGPVCPYENYTSPHNDELCTLWAENQNIESLIFGSTTPISISGLTPLYSTVSTETNLISCVYNNEDMFSSDYCSLWCETQYYKYGQVCGDSSSTIIMSLSSTTEMSTTREPCPYESYAESVVLCFLWEQLETEKQTGSTIHSNTFSIPYTACPHTGLTESTLACQLWCDLQVYTAWTSCTNVPTTTVPCPYTGYADSDTLCSLWQQLNTLTSTATITDASGVTITDSNGNPVTQSYVAITDGSGNIVTDTMGNPVTKAANSITDSNGNVITDSNGIPVTQPLNAVTDSNGLMVTDSNGNIVTIPANSVTDASGNTVTDAIGNIVTDTPNYVTDSNGSTVTDGNANPVTESSTVPYSSCPFISLTDGLTACSIWCQIQELEIGQSCSDVATTTVATIEVCPYESYPESATLCALWYQIMCLIGSGSCYITDAVGNIVTDGSGNPVTYPKNAVTDSNGNIVTDAFGNAITQNPFTFTDSNGNAITDTNGNPITYPANAVTNANGNTVTDSSGNIVTNPIIVVTDSNGITVTGTNGQPVTYPINSVTDANGNVVTDSFGNVVTQ
jgi:hypothetical protein